MEVKVKKQTKGIQMKIPKQCQICGFRKFKETNKKISCQLCGWFIWKDNRQKCVSKSCRGLRTPHLSDSKEASKYFKTKRRPIKEILKEADEIGK